MSSGAITPASKIHFVEMNESEIFSIQMDELFHSILGKVMFITKHSVANMVVDGNQATIVWHVDNKVVDSALAEIVKHFGALSITRGEKHTYVGMDFELPGDGSLIIMAKDYIPEAVQGLERT